jgi:hypothetical protein
MTEIERFRAPTSGGISRRAQHALAQLDDRTSLVVASIQAEADISAAQVDAVGLVAQRAMQEVAFLSQVEQTFGQTVPLAVSRLQAIGDLATLGIGQILTDTATRLRSR